MSDDSPSNSANANSEESPGELTRERTESLTTKPGQPAGESGSDSFSLRNTPVTIGRYEIVSQLGEGGFGFVYEGFDTALSRRLAIKVPRWDRNLRQRDIERFWEEGRTLAKISHPSIVSVYDVGKTEDDVPFVVMEFVEGVTLSSLIKQEKVLEPTYALELLRQVGDALREAHKMSVVHRDLKPGNIIINPEANSLKLVDFGLALHDDLTLSEIDDAIVGTPVYMAPEQVRGENHRIHGQTDIWAFGVMMYRMLTGKYPFKGKTAKELIRAIGYTDPKPPRQINEVISNEIERICLRCLAKQVNSRYQSMQDLLDELDDAYQALVRPTSSVNSSTVMALESLRTKEEPVPDESESKKSTTGRSTNSTTDSALEFSSDLPIAFKGLRSFDSGDKSFFLSLLPGLRDRDGIPDSVKFWLDRLNGVDELERLRLGLIYGPSGCGKSSFVRAGVMPLLPVSTVPVYLECSPKNTEVRLAKQLSRKINSINESDRLDAIFRQIRRGEHLAEGDRLVIFLDQFEQLLHQGIDDNESVLDALRQCDGDRVSCILLVRDDFWMSISQLMKTLEHPIREGQNALALPLFDEKHAKRVLMAYGRLFGKIQPNAEKLSKSQISFVNEAVGLLSNDGKVLCVELAVFAQIVKNRDWNSRELQKIGGLHGVGVLYLSELFPDSNRTKVVAACKHILRELAGNLSIKGEAKTLEQLKCEIENPEVRQAFDVALERLESDHRLISYVDDGIEDVGQSNRPVKLTHDFMVAPIRTWFDQQDTLTFRGRSNLRFREMAAQFNAFRSSKNLPNFIEGIRFLSVDKVIKERPENLEFISNCRKKLIRQLGLGFLLAFVSAVIFSLVQRNLEHARMDSYVSELLAAQPDQFEKMFGKLASDPEAAVQRLGSANESADSTQTLNSRLACYLLSPDNDSRNSLAEQVTKCESDQLSLLLRNLQGDSGFTEALLAKIKTNGDSQEHFRVATLLYLLAEKSELRRLVGSADMVERSQLMDCLSLWNTDGKALFECLSDIENQDEERILLQSLCELSLRKKCISKSQVETLLRIANTTNSTATLSSIQLLLKRNEIPFSFDTVSSDEFEVEMGGNVFARIPLTKHGNGAIVDEFWIDSKEVCNRDFEEFLRSEYAGNSEVMQPILTELIKVVSDRPGAEPARGYSAFVAMEYCNWLNQALGLGPSYEFGERGLALQLVEGGYRLPSLYELDVACNSKQKEAYFFGAVDSRSRINKYIHWIYDCEFEEQPTACANHLPNEFGLFDTIGNVREYCVGKSFPMDSNSAQTFGRGFSYRASLADLREQVISGSVTANVPREECGIRLVKNK